MRGSTVHSKNIGRDILSGLKTIVGVEISDYTNMMNEARAIATKRMVDEAESLGADAVVNVRYASSAIMQGAAEIIAYGTAVKLSKTKIAYYMASLKVWSGHPNGWPIFFFS